MLGVLVDAQHPGHRHLVAVGHPIDVVPDRAGRAHPHAQLCATLAAGVREVVVGVLPAERASAPQDRAPLAAADRGDLTGAGRGGRRPHHEAGCHRNQPGEHENDPASHRHLRYAFSPYSHEHTATFTGIRARFR